MHRARWLIGSLAVLLSIAGCGGDGGTAELGEVESASHSWGGYHWARTSNPFTLMLGDNVSNAWDSILPTASSDWTKSTVLDTTIVAGRSPRKNCKPTSGRVEVCNASYGYNGWLGVAGIWVSGAHITQGYVKVNDSYFSSPTYNTTAWRNLVMCQEIGHTLGLDHQDENFDNANLGSCMDYADDPSTNQHPNQHDYDQLVEIYRHLDSFTTVGATTSTFAGNLPPQASDNADPPDPDDVGPPAWGRLVRSSAGGKLEVWELDLGAGDKVIRFVRRP